MHRVQTGHVSAPLPTLLTGRDRGVMLGGWTNQIRVGEVALLAAALPTLSHGIPSRHRGSGRPERPENRAAFDMASMRVPCVLRGIRTPQNVKLAFPLATFCGPCCRRGQASSLRIPSIGIWQSDSRPRFASHSLRSDLGDGGQENLDRSEFSTRWARRRP